MEYKKDFASYAIISQIKVISAKRLLRKVGKVSIEDFKSIKFAIKNIE